MATYKRLTVWHMAVSLLSEVNDVTRDGKRPTCPGEFSLVQEIRDCARNILQSIVRGAQVNTHSRFLSYLRIANSASIELDTKLRIAKDCGELRRPNIRPLLDKIEEFQKVLTRLRRPLERALERGQGQPW